MTARAAVLIAAASAVLAASGCGEGEGVANGATVTAYVAAPLCAGAKRELAHEKGNAGSVRLRAVCLASERDGKELRLAVVGANARRATEDSTAIAYLEAPGSAAEFSQPILESAEIPSITASSGATAMARLLHVVREADSGSLRDFVREALEQVS